MLFYEEPYSVSWQLFQGQQLSLAPGCVHLWRSHLSTGNNISNFEAILSAEELTRVKRFIKTSDQIKFALSRAITRKVLAYYLDCMPEKIIFSIGEHGKPFVANADLQFNVSHSGDYVLIAATRSNPIGVDIECDKNNSDFLALSKRFFALSEHEAILKCDDQRSAFYRCWTCKEAFIKATGLGLSFGLNNFEIDVNRGSLLAVSRDGFFVNDFTLRSLVLDVLGYYGALVAKGDISEVVYWDF